MTRDMSKQQFEEACERYGFKRAGFLGYYVLPCGVHVSLLSAGPRRRDQLAYLIEAESRNAKRYGKEAVAN